MVFEFREAKMTFAKDDKSKVNFFLPEKKGVFV